jgi:hypothetical protein
MEKYLNFLKVKISNFLEPDPELEEDYVNKVVYLLRRDFKPDEQNRILLAIAIKLSNLREKDMIQLEKELRILQKSTEVLNMRLALN